MKNKQIIIGLTGPIASGKNTAAKVFKRYNSYVIDVDLIGHKVLSSKIGRAFGRQVLSKSGKVNRRKLAEIVFSDKKSLKKLNRLTHPLILNKVKALIKKAKKLKLKFIVINAAVLKKIGLIPYVDKVAVVFSAKNKRLKRLISSGLSKKDALKRIKSQESDAKYRKIADYIIQNNGTREQLLKSVKEIISKIG